MDEYFFPGMAYETMPLLRMELGKGKERPPVLRLVTGGEHREAEIPEPEKVLLRTLSPAGDAEKIRTEILMMNAREGAKEYGLISIGGKALLVWAPTVEGTEALLQGKPLPDEGPAPAGPLAGRIALITGAAQGFGKGLAEHLAADGACVMIADINERTGQAAVEELKEKTGNHAITFVRADVSDSASVDLMVRQTVFAFGGLDLFVSNAGVLKAGGLDVLEEKAFDFVTHVNYKGFYLGVKYASRVMKKQHEAAPGRFMDIIQINSKSGLQGSKRNFAYAGSKFGSIGLVQSFALELVQDNIKVNAVCPGNFFDGPLWSDPKTGLFRQYLEAGKVEGAKTIEDVRRHYESLVPMGRGTTVLDVYRAVRYLIEQEYETGQALPVTGGQVMLR